MDEARVASSREIIGFIIITFLNFIDLIQSTYPGDGSLERKDHSLFIQLWSVILFFSEFQIKMRIP